MSSYLTNGELREFGFKYLGEDVKLSRHAHFYNPSSIEIGSGSRVDDFCIVSGNVTIGAMVHITPYNLISGHSVGLVIEDYCTIAYRCNIFTESDDYTGKTMTGSLIPDRFKSVTSSPIKIERFSIIGCNSTIFPGVNIAVGTSIGACALVLKDTEEWSIYAGQPAVKIRKRKKGLLDEYEKYQNSI
jgi:acetyltransferase-like isoleucine patch superfamily enzyme